MTLTAHGDLFAFSCSISPLPTGEWECKFRGVPITGYAPTAEDAACRRFTRVVDERKPARKFTAFSLFSGIGGIDLAFEREGFEIIGQVEIDDYCNRVLSKHWPHVPRWYDVKSVTRKTIEARHRLRYGAPRAIDVLFGGFPCQDISIAGKQAGISEETRSGLFYELARLVGELRPKYVFLENVANILTVGGTDVVGTLTALGYDCEWGVVPASAVGASHRRERWFCVAYPMRGRHSESAALGQSAYDQQRDVETRCAEWGEIAGGIVASGEILAYANQRGLGTESHQRQVWDVPAGSNGILVNAQRKGLQGQNGENIQSGGFTQSGGGKQPQSRMGGIFDGLSFRLDTSRFPSPPGQTPKEWEAPRTTQKRQADRIKALGNAVVPQVIQPFARAIHAALEAQPAEMKVSA